MAYCPKCGHSILHNSSCNNRNCPSCQYPQQQRWKELRKSETIPDVPYYHIVLTLPHDLNPLILYNMNLLLSLIFRASSDSIITMSRDPHHLGATPGIVSVLHTWTQELVPHFHVHMIVSGGGLTTEGKFITVANRHHHGQDHSGKSFFLPMKAVTKLFRGKFMDGLKRLYTGHSLKLPPEADDLNDPYNWNQFCRSLYDTKWVGFVKQTFNGKGNAIDYLARYTYKTAISNSRIISFSSENVTFRATNRKEQLKYPVTVSAEEFVRRFLTHVLPKSLSRVRYSGFLSNSRKLKNLQKIFQLLLKRDYQPSPLKHCGITEMMHTLFSKDVLHCPCCGAMMEFRPRASPAV